MRGGNVATKGISGTAVGALAIGAVFVWSGINNQDLLTSFRALAMGKPIPKGTQHKASARASGTVPDPTPRGGGGGVGGNRAVVDIAASYKGHPYLFGGGHGKPCPDGPMDCSGYVSCVMNKAGLMKGTLTTSGFAKWGNKVAFEDRQPGDIVVWLGGAGNGHMGIVDDDKYMWHNDCTGCGGVKRSTYGPSRTGRPTIVRRAKGAVSG